MNAIVAFALRQRVLMVVLLLFVFAAGLVGFRSLNIEAYPDPVPPLVDIVTQSTGQSAEEIERYITIPIEIQMAGIPHVTAVRTISLFGLSDVKLQFTYDFTYQQARTVGDQPAVAAFSAAQRRPTADLAGKPDRRNLPLPAGRAAGLFGDGPQDHPGLDPGTALQGGAGRDRCQRLGRQDQDVRRHCRSAQAFEYGLTLPQVLQTLNNSNINVGGQTINFGQQSAVVRGVGLIHTLDDIRNTMLSGNNGAPV